jgi:hypothetical protein
MYINTGYQITNTPSSILAAYNTWPYTVPQNQWYQTVPKYYIDYNGNIKKWNLWNYPTTYHIAGGQYKGTPTRTGGYYSQNIIYEETNI